MKKLSKFISTSRRFRSRGLSTLEYAVLNDVNNEIISSFRALPEQIQNFMYTRSKLIKLPVIVPKQSDS